MILRKKIEHGLAFNVKGDTYQAPKKKREIEKASKISGMKLFFSSPKKEKKTEILIEPDLKDWIQKWLKD